MGPDSSSRTSNSRETTRIACCLNDSVSFDADQRFQLLVDHAPAALALFDREMRYLAVSQRWKALFGLEDRELVGCLHYDVFPQLPERIKEAHQLALSGETVRCDADPVELGQGRWHWSRWEIVPWKERDGTVGGVGLFVEDITAAKQAEQRLMLAACVFNDSSEAIVVTDLDARIVEVNESFTRVTGYSREELIGQNPRILKSGRQDAAFYEEMWRHIREHGRWRGELWNRTKSGDLFAVNSTITTVCDQAGKPQYYVGLLFDLTPIKEQARQLEQMSRYDALTGLINRVLCSERLRQKMLETQTTGQALHIVSLDLDAFKQVNDSLGRQTADALLIATAHRMKQALREGDILARVGGDEFLAVLPNVPSSAAASAIVERLLEIVAQPLNIAGSSIVLTASAGVTSYPQIEDVDAEQLVRQADRAMGEAKLAGKNRIHVFDVGQDHDTRGRYEEIDQIRQALRNQEFVLHYQPRVNMETGEVVGAEALLRWQHPERGLLLPGVFLPAIENNDTIVQVGDWVLDAALDQISFWAQAGFPIPVSVNLSARQIERGDFAERLGRTLARHRNVQPWLLELELVETSALKNLTAVSAIVSACQEMGISVAIDDFGTGYSSLSYLKQVPANVLKIDQSFVRDGLHDPDDLAILQGVLGLASAFRRLPVAEGVETVDHGVLLLRLGCRYGQGYGIARPMPPEALIEWAERWKPDPSWNDVRPLTPLDWPVLIAETEIRAWNQAFTGFMRGERPRAPEMDGNECRFAVWLKREKDNYSGELPVMECIRRLHDRAHHTARQAVEHKKAGRHDEAIAQMQVTLDLREGLRRQLDTLIRPAAAG